MKIRSVLLWFHSKLSFCNNDKFKTIVEIVLYLAAVYVLFRKLFCISIGPYLHKALSEVGFDYLKFFLLWILAIAVFIKILGIILSTFHPSKPIAVEPGEISDSLLSINRELVAHLAKCANNPPALITDLNREHMFSVNIVTIISSMAEHIRKSINVIKVKNKDIFISLYTLVEDNLLRYEVHYDPKRDLVKSKEINLLDKEFQNYECVKCLRSSNSTAYLLNCTKNKKYAKGNSKRHRTVKHYLGCKIESNGYVFGFINVEFHNNIVFGSEEELQDFMEDNIFPFKLLLEYQYLKRKFFDTFIQFDKNWRVK